MPACHNFPLRLMRSLLAMFRSRRTRDTIPSGAALCSPDAPPAQRLSALRLKLGALLVATPAYVLAANAHIDVAGVDSTLRNNVLAHLSLADEPCDAPTARLEQRMNSASREITQALQALGHYQASFTKSLTHEGKCWSARFDITPGPVVVVKSFTLQLSGAAVDDPAFQALRRTPALKEGDPLRHDRYQSVKDALADLAARRGYLDARFLQAELLVDPAHGRADVRLHFDSGPRYRLGHIQLLQRAYDAKLVTNLLLLKEGEFYDAERLRAQHEAFNTSGMFESALIQPRNDARKDGVVPINIRLEPRKVHAYAAGAGLSTDTGPQLKLSYENRRLNSAGHTLSAEMSASPVISEVKFGYRIPLKRASTDSLGFDAGIRNEDTDTTTSRSVALGARHSIGHAHDWIETRYLQLSREDFRVGGQSDTALLVLPGLSFARRAVDDPVRPTRGLRLHGEVRGTTQALGSNVSFGQLLGDARWIRPLPHQLRLITRGELGFTAQDRFQDLPTSVRFFAGGDSSVRGYDYRALGPRNSDGEVIGGRYLAVGSVELERQVYGNFGVAPFFDVGNAFNNFSDPLAESAGIGIRWRSPLGPVGVDFAHPFYLSDEVLRIHLRFGPEI